MKRKTSTYVENFTLKQVLPLSVLSLPNSGAVSRFIPVTILHYVRSNVLINPLRQLRRFSGAIPPQTSWPVARGVTGVSKLRSTGTKAQHASKFR
jgi:hypothetical protein